MRSAETFTTAGGGTVTLAVTSGLHGRSAEWACTCGAISENERLSAFDAKQQASAHAIGCDFTGQWH